MPSHAHDALEFIVEGPSLWPHERIECKDGFSVSVQVGRNLYCTPRDNYGPYTHVELGFPSASLGPEFAEYKDGIEFEDTKTVFGYVPVELVRKLIESHGGEA